MLNNRTNQWLVGLISLRSQLLVELNTPQQSLAKRLVILLHRHNNIHLLQGRNRNKNDPTWVDQTLDKLKLNKLLGLLQLLIIKVNLIMVNLVQNHNDLLILSVQINQLQQRLNVRIVGLVLTSLNLTRMTLLIKLILVLDQVKHINNNIAPKQPINVFLKPVQIRVQLKHIEDHLVSPFNPNRVVRLPALLLLFLLNKVH